MSRCSQLNTQTAGESDERNAGSKRRKAGKDSLAVPAARVLLPVLVGGLQCVSLEFLEWCCSDCCLECCLYCCMRSSSSPKNQHSKRASESSS